MSGVRPEWVAGTNFIMLHLDLVDALDGDMESALVLDRIRFRAGRDGWWAASYADMQHETRLSEWKVKRAIKVLRDLGMIESQRVRSFDASLKWRLVMVGSPLHEMEESSGTSPVKEESSVTVKEESSFSPSLEQEEPSSPVPGVTGRTRYIAPTDPETHPSRPIQNGWLPAPGFRENLRLTYPEVNLAESHRRFVDYHLSRQDTSRSWEAAFRAWVSRDSEQILEKRGGTDDMGIPRNQRKAPVTDTEEQERQTQELIDLAVRSAAQARTEQTHD